MKNYIYGILAVMIVVIASIFMNGAEYNTTSHYLTAEQKCDIYLQVMDGCFIHE